MDNDSYGHVNNVTYYSYFDTAVNEHLIRCGSLDIAGDPAIGYVVETSCRFAKPLSFPETIDVGLRVVRLGTTSVTYEIGIFRRGDDEPAATGRFVHVWVDRATVRPVPIPPRIRAALMPLARPSRATPPGRPKRELPEREREGYPRRDSLTTRIGNGFDVHALVAGRRLVLGGVEIPHERGLDGHSDADVLLHAVCDAILGALALGDLGGHFPDSDPRWKGADSRMLLRHVASLGGDRRLAHRQPRRHRDRAGAEARAARARDARQSRRRPRVRTRRRQRQGNDHRGPRIRGERRGHRGAGVGGPVRE